MGKDRRPDRLWGLPLGAAVLTVLFGLLLVVRPDVIAGILPPFLGLILLVTGIQGLAHGIALHRRLMEPGLKLLRGVLSVVVGLVLLMQRDVSIAFITVLCGLYIIITAMFRLSAIGQKRRDGEAWYIRLASYLFQVILGVLMMIAPFDQRYLWLRALGAYFVVSGASTLLWVLRTKKNSHKTGDEQK